MSIYAPDIVTFDIEPPLQHVGTEAKRKNWSNAFSIYQPPFSYEIHDLAIAVADDMAFGRGLIRSIGTLKNGRRIERWLRSTMCFRRLSGNWLIAHDHVSAPLDLQTGKALLNLEPRSDEEGSKR
jgi:ketosteroid isomerase-like protein